MTPQALIKKRGHKWVVHTEDGQRLGIHDTQKRALRQKRALEKCYEDFARTEFERQKHK
jgi:hypothetical protein